jgi:hypothetical protein
LQARDRTSVTARPGPSGLPGFSPAVERHPRGSRTAACISRTRPPEAGGTGLRRRNPRRAPLVAGRLRVHRGQISGRRLRCFDLKSDRAGEVSRRLPGRDTRGARPAGDRGAMIDIRGAGFGAGVEAGVKAGVDTGVEAGVGAGAEAGVEAGAGPVPPSGPRERIDSRAMTSRPTPSTTSTSRPSCQRESVEPRGTDGPELTRCVWWADRAGVFRSMFPSDIPVWRSLTALGCSQCTVE